ncbi:MAG: hypothetical protein FJX03_07075 [Alphaproteobacteria bacterium]|nr:hypothetical protein [Alphaproteobacteria bacterium]
MLKLIVSKTKPSPKILSLPDDVITNSDREPFHVNVLPKGHLLFVMTAIDPSHFLSCELVLEVVHSPNDNEPTFVVCHFPEIQDDELYKFIDQDEMLLGLTMVDFQMKVLEQLYNFCLTHHASNLVIYTDNNSGDALGIYREFLTTIHETTVKMDTFSEIIFPVCEETNIKRASFMDIVSLKLRQTLWQEQRYNFAVKKYLKSHPFG